ncbi:MAG: translation elongation factor Ts [Armatimonadetes bacterium CG_4_10_14_3_um_filter_66_18]|nr:translation elongation factor Ts [Armatimonadota bacterium]OIP01085.1 MAG: translation elongation factor Ts [Armatimonadetes bacterium CG2_30_66_41]PIU92786.1 MAG: translation elongation factor Ts [Armatimonadetes bacterium CG06_land_8_20_14_3_00_66_21]PIW14250.1 MAG: translation elongation factor Ts [Armatimonadetes bacterium CG17_big_fil_post_rev_8_21_14_2_50_66_6]PIX39813.1 MAG: translation elongation factor Ts [Armatimonadetes bacterium CG_4_8_14_3_um_filter_66_20]PIY53664.1 MAG: transl
MSISAADVKTLRERTSAGMMDCKAALVEAAGDMEKAVQLLREKGLAVAAKKATRAASDGLVEAYIHVGGKVGVLVELNCETDFVARTDEFRQLARDIAMQIAAMAPEYLAPEDVPQEVLDREREILLAQAKQEGKPESIAEKMVAGRLRKFYDTTCLLRQEFIKDEGKQRSIEELLTETVAKVGENVVIKRFSRFKIGEEA